MSEVLGTSIAEAKDYMDSFLSKMLLHTGTLVYTRLTNKSLVICHHSTLMLCSIFHSCTEV